MDKIVSLLFTQLCSTIMYLGFTQRYSPTNFLSMKMNASSVSCKFIYLFIFTFQELDMHNIVIWIPNLSQVSTPAPRLQNTMPSCTPRFGITASWLGSPWASAAQHIQSSQLCPGSIALEIFQIFKEGWTLQHTPSQVSALLGSHRKM